jgi:ribose-phosphate pyrophosphokinase
MPVKIIGLQHESFKFAGGEIQVRIAEKDLGLSLEEATIRADIRNSDDIMETFLLTDALYRAYPGIRVALLCPYFPYARQDRVCFRGEAFSAQAMCILVNAQSYSRVEVWDAHSDIILRHGVHRIGNLPAYTLLNHWFTEGYPIGVAIVVAPDKGAIVRATGCATMLGTILVKAEKIRDPDTGNITDTAVYSGHVGNRDFLMVDDICDGGRTFIELAKKLRKLTTGRVMLYVTHGIFSAGFEVFRGLIDHIYVANCFPAVVPEFVSVRPS